MNTVQAGPEVKYRLRLKLRTRGKMQAKCEIMEASMSDYIQVVRFNWWRYDRQPVKILKSTK